MKMVLFDLGGTLEFHNVLLPGARETLEAIAKMRDAQAQPIVLALVSDFFMPTGPEEIPAIRQRYLDLLDILGIRAFFEPVEQRVTLSTEVGVFKPDQRIFEAVIEKSGLELTWQDIIFITENREHVEAARGFGMHAVHFRGPGQLRGELQDLRDLPRMIEEFLDIPTARALLRPQRETLVARCTLPADLRQSWADPAGSLAASWVRFGDETLLLTDQSDWADITERAGRSASELERRGSVTRRERLHLVVQKGKLFQQTHPEVPVLHDRGRFLVVDLEPIEAQRLGQREEPCWAIQPLSENQVIFFERPRVSLRAVPQPEIQVVVDRLSRERFESALTHLASFPTRLSTSAHYTEAATWAREQLATHYLTRTEVIEIQGRSSLNVIAEKPGSGFGTRGVVLVVAHLDSINQRDGPEARAPGADDNASGSAGLIEIARVLGDQEHDHDLRCILFGGEEQGLLGSRQYLANLPEGERARIRAVLNMDMIGVHNLEGPRSVLVEGAALSSALVEKLEQAALDYTSLMVQISFSPFASDHVSFIQAGIPAVLTIEGADSSNEAVHSEHDTLERIDLELALEILRMNIAFISAELRLRGSDSRRHLS